MSILRKPDLNKESFNEKTTGNIGLVAFFKRFDAFLDGLFQPLRRCMPRALRADLRALQARMSAALQACMSSAL